jgi:hypothetical protein
MLMNQVMTEGHFQVFSLSKGELIEGTPMQQNRENRSGRKRRRSKSTSSTEQVPQDAHQFLSKLKGLPLTEVKRPPNGFMLFCSEWRAKLLRDLKIPNHQVSKVLGKMWKEMSAQEKEPYLMLSKKINKAFKELFPNFSWHKEKKIKTSRQTDCISIDTQSNVGSTGKPVISSPDDAGSTDDASGDQPHERRNGQESLLAPANAQSSLIRWPAGKPAPTGFKVIYIPVLVPEEEDVNTPLASESESKVLDDWYDAEILNEGLRAMTSEIGVPGLEDPPSPSSPSPSSTSSAEDEDNSSLNPEELAMLKSFLIH